MLKRKFRLSIVFCLFVLSAGSHVKTPAQTAELEKLFAEAVAAVGKPSEIEKIKSIEAVADCDGPKGKYTTEIKSFPAGRTYFKQTYSYRDSGTEVFINRNLAWNKPAADEFALVSPFQKLVVELHEYQKMAFDFEKMFTDFESAGEEDFGGRPSFKVAAENSLGGTVYLFFDKETKLLSGYILPVPGSDQTVENVFNEWKTVGRIKLPSKITATDSSGVWVLNFDRITLNRTAEKTLDIPPRVADLAELMRLHEQHQTAHLTYDAGLFVETFAENLVTVQRGEVVTRSREQNLERIKNYFGSYKFREWKDIKPPVFKISKDGTLATVIVEKLVTGTYANEKGETVEDKTEFAWLEVWEKIGGKWKITTVASTRKQ
jgi:hypothetical protein